MQIFAFEVFAVEWVPVFRTLKVCPFCVVEVFDSFRLVVSFLGRSFFIMLSLKPSIIKIMLNIVSLSLNRVFQDFISLLNFLKFLSTLLIIIISVEIRMILLS